MAQATTDKPEPKYGQSNLLAQAQRLAWIQLWQGSTDADSQERIRRARDAQGWWEMLTPQSQEAARQNLQYILTGPNERATTAKRPKRTGASLWK